MNQRDREHFDWLQSLPTRTDNQQRLLDSMLRWDVLEAHHDNREREWHARGDQPSRLPAVHSSGGYTGRYASNDGYAEALGRIDGVLADTAWQPAPANDAAGRAR